MKVSRFAVPNRANSRLWQHPTINPFRTPGGPLGPVIIISGVYDLKPGDQGQRVGLTCQVGSIAPTQTPGGSTIQRLFARKANGNVTFKLENYTGTYVGDVLIDYGVGPDLTLVYEGGGVWSGVSTEFRDLLMAVEQNNASLSMYIGAD